ncbi:MAG: HPF/RaiA family ribosome-associated protein [Ardenticatenaceae bacterium]|nr:HPF/RaiA family ribosome-associated protein [Ardenticatenaceae bacterium]
MNELDFTLELNSEDLNKETEYDLFTTAESFLKQLAADHDDMVGAAINIRRPAHGETTYLYEVTVVVYSRPEHIAATDKASDPQLALDNALDAAARQIRQRREKLKKRWERPGNEPVDQEVIEVMAAEETNPDEG